MKHDFEERKNRYLDLINAFLWQLPEKADTHTASSYEIVKQAMRYSLEAGGKRIRPMLALEFSRIYGGAVEQTLPLACAVELVHTYSLIHDDLPCMDNDDFRRGKPSCHKKFGEANALLAGDALLTLAFEIIAAAPETAGTNAGACLNAVRILSALAGADGMIGGQVMDLCHEDTEISIDRLKQTNRLKTCCLLESACMIGAYAAKAPESGLIAAKEYADGLGMAFQIVDDILDVEGNEAVLGKPIGSDAECKKSTFVSLCGLKEAKQAAEQETARALAALHTVPDNSFLTELTRELLTRDR